MVKNVAEHVITLSKRSPEYDAEPAVKLEIDAFVEECTELVAKKMKEVGV